jgi:TolB protein
MLGSATIIMAQDAIQIVYSSELSGNSEIYVMNSDGSNIVQLTNNSFFDSEPVWSPDRSQIAFTSERDGVIELYVMNADGSDERVVTSEGGFVASPSWSPDGRTLAYELNRGGDTQIILISVDGTNARPITATGTNFQTVDPAWSPNGREIAFASTQSGNFEIYLMNADGSNVRQVGTNPGADNRSPAWSPDGTQIAFVASYGRDSEIVVMNSDGTNLRPIAVNGNSFSDVVTWSPDAQQVAYMVWTPSGDRYIQISGVNAFSTARLNGGYPSWASLTPTSGSDTATSGGVFRVSAYDYDTYPGGFQVTVTDYEIDSARDVVRMYFNATATQTTLRNPNGTYLNANGQIVYPLDTEWSNNGLTYYEGWFEFAGSYFRSGRTNSLIYCGCGFYDIPLTDLSGYFGDSSSDTTGGSSTQVYESYLSSGEDNEQWTFIAHAGDRVRITQVSRDFDSFLTLLDPNNRQIANNDDGLGNLDSLIEQTLSQSGTYTVLAGSYRNSGTGDYTLTITITSRASSGGGGTLTDAVNQAAYLSYGEEAVWTFNADTGNLVTIRMESSDFDSYLELYDPSNRLITTNDDGGGNLNSLISSQRLVASGTYTVIARSYGNNDSGNYVISIQISTNDASGLPFLVYDQEYDGYLTEGERQLWTFQGNAGDVITIRLNSNQFDPYLELYAPEGGLLESDDDGGDGLNSLINRRQLLTTGTYTIIVRDYGDNDNGNFTLEVERR